MIPGTFYSPFWTDGLVAFVRNGRWSRLDFKANTEFNAGSDIFRVVDAQHTTDLSERVC